MPHRCRRAPNKHSQNRQERSQSADALAGGWRLSGILIAQTGAPFTVNLGTSNDVANIGLVNSNNIERPNLTGDPNAGPKTANRWFDTAAFSLPAAFTFGNNPRNSVVGSRFVNFDTSLQKDWALRESINLQFRWTRTTRSIIRTSLCRVGFSERRISL
jgi:hypothetical protein